MDTPGRIAELERKFADNPRRYFAALANEFRKQGELERAIELCEVHLAEQRNHLSGHVVLAQALIDSGRDADAWDPLHTALDLDPENFIALRLIGELFARVGDADHARTYFFRALEIEPRNEQLLTAVKNLAQRPAGAVAPEPAVAAASWGDVELHPRTEGSVAYDAEAAAEPVAEELPSLPLLADEQPPFGEPPVEEPPVEEPPVEQPPVEQPPVEQPPVEQPPVEAPPVEAPSAEPGVPGAGASVDSAFTDWLPVSGAAPAPGEDWVSAAGSVPAEQSSDWDSAPVADEPGTASAARYDAHDWLPPLEDDSGEAPQPVEHAEPAEPEPDEARPVLASETMADLYEQQGHISLAVDVLRELVASRPQDEGLRARLSELERAAAAPPRQTVRDMFAQFARTAGPLRERARPGARGHATPANVPQDSGPLAEFFGDSPATGNRSEALLAMVAPPASAPQDEGALGRWLAELRSS